jgi:DNA-directed RNA polymerase subunit RPC12/RpoP
MGLQRRVKRLKKQTGLDRDPPCPECNGRLLYRERAVDGTISYPQGGRPCSTCNNIPPAGGIGIIEIRDLPRVSDGN